MDDEADIADMLESYFRLEGYRTLVARDAAGAVEAAGRAPDAILLDVNLPDADGFSVCREIRELVACPIIFLTARVEDADAIAGFAAGGDDYVTKPFSLEVLGARVRAQLARDRARSTARRCAFRAVCPSTSPGARPAWATGRPRSPARTSTSLPSSPKGPGRCSGAT